ncbi:hypothetical protein B5X24_HaOG204578 [Helicoverpa armigera]|nr:uncharacterized protein LOC110369829 [Helicoverpa armigera]PZC84548.1 hypothetical protein B5X24_HaOG204578 [Helicoverpa armigera]
MYVCTSVRPLSACELQFRRKALRDAVICIGWLKLLSLFCYLGIYLLVFIHSKGKWSSIIQLMVLIVIPFQIINGILLFLGALEIKVLALELALWLCVLLAAYNTVLGLIGGIYFIRTGFLTVHFLLSLMFAIQSLSIFTVLCHDVIVIYTFRSLVQNPPPGPPQPSTVMPTPSLPSNDAQSRNPSWA